MKETNQEKVVFNVENIQKGLFGSKQGGGKISDWNMFASLRLLEESGQQLSEQMRGFVNSIKYKWYYYNKKSDNNQGNIIIGLHKKDVEGWIYVVVNQDGEYEEYEKLIDAKNNISNELIEE